MKDFKELADTIVSIYDVESYQDNPEDVEEENYWFQCPVCGDYIVDGDFELSDMIYRRGVGFVCGICGELSELR